ncbi:hypothetical protein CDV31_014741 [Fusarium ambrosium]|uniref:Extracellular membrane protein CFEM domain-containing protein n=1 Tax=Fusarium ambrosium TaxID=131363 RepID=A0A428SU73_9HYPO|nr:hypothetical protein CDV31_014741 [Fusarium ambrosium]
MRFSSAVLFAGNALVIAQQECLSQNSADLAAYADCADQSALASCLSKLESTEGPAVQACYTDAGCSSDEAAAEARRTWQRCEELAKGEDLKKRFPAAPLPTLAPRVAAAGESGPKVKRTLFKRETADTSSGKDCLTAKVKDTTACDVKTKSGSAETGSCSSVTTTTSTCRDDVICTMLDNSNETICLVKKEMDTAGIIIAIVFAGALALMMGYLTFMCCRDKKEQKRLAAKSEAVALARAATKKQRAAQRQPLIRNASGQSNPSNAGANPFGDQTRI